MGDSSKRSLASALNDLGLGSTLEDMSGLGEIDPREISELDRFRDLYPIDDSLLEAIAENMKLMGFDKSQPLIVWKDSPAGHILVDGHTRRRAAIKAALKRVPVYYISATSEDQVELYAHHLQLNRRNLSDAQKLRIVRLKLSLEEEEKSAEKPLDAGGVSANVGRNSVGRPSKSSSSRSIAAAIRSSKGTAEKVIAVAKADPEIQKKVETGELSLNQAFNQIQVGGSDVVVVEGLRWEKSRLLIGSVPVLNLKADLSDIVENVAGLRDLLFDAVKVSLKE